MLIKLWLVRAMPLLALENADYDDFHFVEQAWTLLQGHWLGVYDKLTLSKGIFYPIWISLCFVFNVPLLAGQVLLYALSCVVLVVALRSFVRGNGILFLTFFLVFWSPTTFGVDPGSRVIRDGIYPALALLTFSGFVGLSTRWGGSLRTSLGWAVLAGVAMAAFWLTREEGVWILPSLILICGFVLMDLFFWRRDLTLSARLRVGLLFAVPVFLLVTTVTLVATVNFVNYKAFYTVDVESKSFLRAYGALTRVRPAHTYDGVPVTREAMQRIAVYSASFRELEPYLRGSVGQWGVSVSEENGYQKGEIAAGWFQWVLRGVVQEAGYYRDAGTADAFYERLANEINEACDKKQLDALPYRMTLAPPLTWDDLGKVISSFSRAFLFAAEFHDLKLEFGISTIGQKTKKFQDLTRERILSSSDLRFEPLLVSGWVFSEDASVSVWVEQDGGAISSSELVKRIDAAGYLGAMHMKVSGEAYYGFQIHVPSSQGLLVLAKNNIPVAKLPLVRMEAGPVPGHPEMLANIEIAHGNPKRAILLAQNTFDSVKLRILQAAGKVYQIAMPSLLVIALASLLVMTVLVLRTKEYFLNWLIQVVLLGVFLTRVFLVSLVDATSFHAVNVQYLASGYPFLIAFVVLSISQTILYWKERLTGRPHISRT